ncbi:MAG: NAD(P)/FAD-dependent oxidoreductase, partial [Pseudomonadales bacterium]
MSTERVDTVVIGAGVVGLAVARALALAGRDVLVLERHDAIGTETSARNSEVIHAGIYYPTGSLRARLCVRGKELLYDYLATRGVPHRRCGKVLVAVDDAQRLELEKYRQQAAINGAGDLRPLTGGEVKAMEPQVVAVAGLLSASTGIIDSHAYMLALQGDLEAAGGMVVLNTPVEKLAPQADGVDVVAESMTLRARTVINCAGLSAPALASTCMMAPTPYYARGRYYTYSGRSPFNRLVYPMPEPGGLGVHVTLDLAGQARFGPDVAWIDGVDYHFDDSARDV